MNTNSRPELDELLGAYALDAIEPVERFEMDRYLDENHDARHEVDELRETAALLALLHVQREPVGEHVWEGIQSAIVDSERGDDADVIPLRDARDGEAAARGRHRRSVPLPIAALLVAAASVAIVLLAARHDTSGRSLASAFHRAAAQGHEVAIVGKTGTLAHVVRGADGAGYLRVDHLPALPPGKVYQLWVAAPGKPGMISLGVLGSHPRPYSTFAFIGRPQAFALSIERAPGASVPTDAIGQGSA